MSIGRAGRDGRQSSVVENHIGRAGSVRAPGPLRHCRSASSNPGPRRAMRRQPACGARFAPLPSARHHAPHVDALLALQHRARWPSVSCSAPNLRDRARVARSPPVGGTRCASRLVDVLADAEDASASRGRLRRRARCRAAQHVDQVTRAEALAGAVDRRQRLARGFGGVPGLRRLQAVVAVAARLAGLAEIVQQRTRRQPAVSHRPSSASSFCARRVCSSRRLRTARSCGAAAPRRPGRRPSRRRRAAPSRPARPVSW